MTGNCIQCIENAHTLNVSTISVSPFSDSQIFSGSRDYSVKAWDTSSGTCTIELKEPRNIVTTLQASPTSPNVLYQGAEDLCVRVWDLRESSLRPTIHLAGYIYFPTCMDVALDGWTVATGCKGFDRVGCEVRVWDVRRPARPLCDLRGHAQDVTACQFLDGLPAKGLLSASKDGCLMAWSAEGGEGDAAVWTRAALHSLSRCITSLATLPRGGSGDEAEAEAVGQAVLACRDGSLHVFSLPPVAGDFALLLSTPEFAELVTEEKP